MFTCSDTVTYRRTLVPGRQFLLQSTTVGGCRLVEGNDRIINLVCF